jgi:DNA-binding NtrC family response regulator
MSKILLIEDDIPLREVMTSYMTRRGHRVTACGSIADASRALLYFETHDALPDTVVADINLGDGSGLNFYLRHARRLPSVQWIIMSGDHEMVRQAAAERASGWPGCAVIDKPVPLRLLNRYLEEGRLPPSPSASPSSVAAQDPDRRVGEDLGAQHDVRVSRILREMMADAADRGHEHHR